jgi:transcriptional regulator with XRE-family HTH domain
MTQLELAERVGVTEGTISNWESGRSGGVEWIKNVVLLCEVLECQLPDLLGQDLGELRKKSNLTQRSLSKIFGVRENTIATWEKNWNVEGNAYKRVELVGRLCSALACLPSDLAPTLPPKKSRGSYPNYLSKPLPTEKLIQELRAASKGYRMDEESASAANDDGDKPQTELLINEFKEARAKRNSATNDADSFSS